MATDMDWLVNTPEKPYRESQAFSAFPLAQPQEEISPQTEVSGHDHCGEKITQTAISEGEYREQTGKAGAGIPLSQQKDIED
ncbi:hypothetical protein HGM15179_003767 [Zosterops borbonicus]|uniref:Uncharacterized protein n=1 Tax=Zosterops borbonicus TaxID=364589 RepID=A0A8K1GTY8_9PASS|nr:hypothetical protein HGM15179_003767 [Zosterops borbonicus]